MFWETWFNKMDEDINIINTKTRNEKIKNFFVNNRKIIISIVSVVIILLLSYFSYFNDFYVIIMLHLA